MKLEGDKHTSTCNYIFGAFQNEGAGVEQNHTKKQNPIQYNKLINLRVARARARARVTFQDPLLGRGVK